MEYNFARLLEISNELEKNKKFLQDENPEAFKVFLHFLVTIEENLHYAEKQKYLKLANDFLTDKISADDFTFSFLYIYEGITKKLDQMRREKSSDLENLLDEPHLDGLGNLLVCIYGSCDSFSLDPDINLSSEEELRNYAQILVSKLQEE